MKPGLLACLLLAYSACGAAAELRDCVGIEDEVVRLFCYDRAAGRSAARPMTENPAPPAAAVPAASSVAVPAPAAAPSATPEVAAPAPEEKKSRIEARVAGRFEGWSPGQTIKLDNGQTWRSVGPGTHYSTSDSPKVVIERDFFGQTLMAVEGVKSKAIVQRVEP